MTCYINITIDNQAMDLTESSTPCPPLMFDSNFGKCGPIFKILSPDDS